MSSMIRSSFIHRMTWGGSLLLLTAWLAAGCGCQRHGVSDVTVTPETPCLQLRVAGDSLTTDDTVGLCESVLLLGHNGCTATLHLPASPEVGGSGPVDVAPATDFQYEVAPGMTTGKTYTIDATLDGSPIVISFRISDQQQY